MKAKRKSHKRDTMLWLAIGQVAAGLLGFISMLGMIAGE